MKAIFQTLIIFVIGAVVILTTAFFVKKFKEPEVVEKIVETKVKITAPECQRNFTEFTKLVNSGQYFKVLENARSQAQNGFFTQGSVHETAVHRVGEIACGYLYVEASAGGKPLDDKYDSIFVEAQNYGGHLVRTRSIETEGNQGTTKVLFELNSIPYLPNVPYNPNAKDFRISNWVKLFGVNSSVDFRIALSTQSAGFIKEVGVAYKCWNPDTGDETFDCQLSK